MKPGTTSRASSVTFQLSSSMAVRVVARTKRSEVTVDRVPTACWAPRTSLDRRDSSDPVCVWVKKATGIRWTWPNSATRRS